MTYTQQIGSHTFACDAAGLVQIVGQEPAPLWCARNMDRPGDAPVEFVAEGHERAKAVAKGAFGTGNCVCWRNGDDQAPQPSPDSFFGGLAQRLAGGESE